MLNFCDRDQVEIDVRSSSIWFSAACAAVMAHGNHLFCLHYTVGQKKTVPQNEFTVSFGVLKI